MDKEFLLKLFFTRWVILIFLSVVLAEALWLFWKIEGGYRWMKLTGLMDAACRLVLAPIFLVGLTIFHIWQYSQHLSPFVTALGAGLISGAGTALVTLGYTRFVRKLEPFGIHAVLTVLLFPLGVKFIEPWLLKMLL